MEKKHLTKAKSKPIGIPMRNANVLISLKCLRCKHTWIPRQREVRLCPKCKTPWWDRIKSG